MTFKTDPHNRAVLALVAILVAYVASAMVGSPQRATARISAQQHEAVGTAPKVFDEAKQLLDRDYEANCACPPLWMVMPFTLLLLSIAILPLIPRAAHWWESNLHKSYIAGGLSLLTLGYYLFVHRLGVVGHWPIEYISLPAVAGPSWNLAGTILSNAILNEFLPFIFLLFSLYTITGGIRIEGDLPAHALTNTIFLAVGAVLASLIGTTGASMLLIRPLLETNSERKHVQHTVVMFIFIVCNCGGCLLPLGDPPLFLGYLFGVPFLWTLKLWPAWLLVNGLLLSIYFGWDNFWCYPQESARVIQRDESTVRPMRFRGLWPNVLLLVGVIASVALLDPGKPFLGTNWHPWVYLREVVQSGMVLISLCSGTRVRRDNGFGYGAILEVAVLFLGIFVCMQAPLDILHVKGASLGLAKPAHFFWASGILSSVLDNAPTYAVYFETARSLGGQPPIAGVQEQLLAAVSLGSVFMGAMTYIGNGPNFMVKAIAEKSGVAMPSFFGYIVYSAVILLPIFALVTFVLLR
jgi:Na+/H+ antiporter NhaD/arsenite permease-like protein